MIVHGSWKFCWRSFSVKKVFGVDTFEHAKISPILGPFLVAEGPHWDKASKSLLFVDILGKSVNRYVPSTSFYKKLPLEDTVSLVIPVKDTPNKYIISLGVRLVLLSWDGKTVYHSFDELTALKCPGVRFNDGKADHLGNIWLGSMAKEKEDSDVEEKYKGEFYRFGTDSKLEVIEKRVSISNGIAWNVKKNLMYYIDSLERRVDVFDYDVETAEACNRRPFFDFKKNNVKGLPDGMTTDCDDNLWVACYGGSQVLKISGRTGIVLGLLKFPTELISSVAFGGDENNIMYVTSISHGMTKEKLAEQPKAGFVFEVKGLGVTGPEAQSAIMKKTPGSNTK